MKCCICKKEIEDYGNNPQPLCAKDDYTSRCCDECNQYVISARILQSKEANRKPKPNDLIVIFYCKESDEPIKTLLETGKVLAGYVDIDENFNKNLLYGTWGNFPLNLETDSYSIIKK